MTSRFDETASRNEQVDRLIAAWREAAAQEKPGEIEEFIAAHSEFTTELREFFANHGALENAGGWPKFLRST